MICQFSRVLVLCAVASLSACIVATPAPSLEGLPAVARQPIHAGIYYSPEFEAAERRRYLTERTSWTARIGEVSVKLFDALLPRVFEKPRV
jgi:hypothetical protein